MNAILRLYPRAWRERYGDEVTALLEERPASWLDHADLIRGALDAHLHPQVPGTDVAPEQEIPMDRKLLGTLAAIGGLIWIAGVATMFILPKDADGYRQGELAFAGFALGGVMMGIAVGLLGTRPDSRQSRMTGLIVVGLSIILGVLGIMSWPIFILSTFGFPILAVIAAARGSRNGVLPLWIAVAFFAGAVGVFAGSLGGIATDLGLALFSLVGVAGLLLAGSGLTGRVDPVVVSPA